MNKLYLLVSILLCGFIVAGGSLAVSANANEAKKQCFDAGFYASENPDVVAVYGSKESALLKHYLAHGRYEGRSASAEFNLMSYRAENKDLYLAFADDLDAYPAHYLEYGKAEGRVAMTDNPPKFEAFKRPLIYEIEGIAYGRKEIGLNYVEVDLANQHLYLFIDGEVIMDTAIVTGDEKKKHSTPAGVFKIYHKGTDRYLRGPGYKNWVSYWMPFNGGIGFHDATWRSKFGGSIYKSNGSHGCINMPFKKAETLFEYAYVGMYVVCH